MATAQEILDGVTEIVASGRTSAAALASLDLKLDEVRAKIDSLPSGSVVTQEQLDSIAASLQSAKDVATEIRNSSAAVLSEAEALVPPVEPPPVEG